MRASGPLTVVAVVAGAISCGGRGAGPPPSDKGQAEFERVRATFGVLETLAGAGKRQDDVNEWDPAFEGGPATAAELSSPHNAVGDGDGNVFIADKEAHAIRKVTPDGRIETAAGVNTAGDDGDAPGDARALHLDWPNGVWVAASGTVYILDLGNLKVRRLDRTGRLSTLFVAPTLAGGRGLWVADDETVAYVSSVGDLLRWTPSAGVTALASGFVDLGNLIVDPDGSVLVTDRGASRVFRVSSAGVSAPIAGSGAAGIGDDGLPALDTPLDEVRGIWRVPGAGLLVGTHHGSRVFRQLRFRARVDRRRARRALLRRRPVDGGRFQGERGAERDHDPGRRPAGHGTRRGLRANRPPRALTAAIRRSRRAGTGSGGIGLRCRPTDTR